MGRREGLKIPFGITECRFESGSEHEPFTSSHTGAIHQCEVF